MAARGTRLLPVGQILPQRAELLGEPSVVELSSAQREGRHVRDRPALGPQYPQSSRAIRRSAVPTRCTGPRSRYRVERSLTVDTLPSYAESDLFDGAIEAVPHPDRYGGFLRLCGAVASGVIWGYVLVESVKTGVALAVDGRQPEGPAIVFWQEHWVWRTLASLAATGAAAFVAGMVARRRGVLVGILSGLPTAAYWGFVAYVGWTGDTLGLGDAEDLSLGYRIIAIVLALASVPCSVACAKEGTAYGHANAEHFDSRRGTFLGIRWYQFLWLPVLLHLMILTAAFGAVHGSLWLIAAWKTGLSVFSIVPALFYLGMLGTLQLLATGAWRSYEVLAGFEECSATLAVGRVLKFGFGYLIAAGIAQAAIVAVQVGLAALLQKL